MFYKRRSVVHLIIIQDDLDSKIRLAESPEMSIRCSSGSSIITSTSPLSSKPSSAGGGAPTPEWDNNFMDWVTYEKVKCQSYSRRLAYLLFVVDFLLTEYFRGTAYSGTQGQKLQTCRSSLRTSLRRTMLPKRRLGKELRSPKKEES